MSYIGVPPQATFSSGLLDRFTSTTGTTVTLTHDIASENDIVVFVNFVKQDSTTYSVGGTGNTGETGASGGEWGASGGNTSNTGDGGDPGAAITPSGFTVTGVVNSNTIKGSY